MRRPGQSDFRPAETHRNPSGDQLQHKPAGVTTIIGQVIGKLDAAALLSTPAFQLEVRLSESDYGTSTTSVPW